MILPHPESDMNLNIMVLGADLVRSLKSKNDFILIDNLMNDFLKNNPKRSPDMFLNTLTFLYSFGIIEHKGYKIKLIPKQSQQMSLF